MNLDEIKATLQRGDGRYPIRDVVAVTAFAGKPGIEYPDVPTADGIDVAALTEGDPAPFFVTLRIGEIDAVSGNGHWFDEAFEMDLIQQTIERRATGIMGHLRDEDRGSLFPVPDVYWVGALLAQDFAWGKAYVPPGEVREFLRRKKAQGGEVATSIYGTAGEIEWVEEREAWKPLGFILESLDLAPPERAGVPSLAVVPKVTAEMSNQAPPPGQEPNPMKDKLEVLAALTADDARLLPDAVVSAVVQPVNDKLAAHEQQIAELCDALDVEDADQLTEAVKALVEACNDAQAEAVKAKMAALVETVQVEGVRPIVMDLVQAEHPTTVQAVEKAFESVMEREHVKALVQAQVAKQNPRQRRPIGQTSGGNNPYVIIPEVESDAE